MAKYPGTLETNNINEYGIVKADQIQGHRVVDTPEDLTKLTPAQLSIDKTDQNSEGALWYVKSNNCFYYLSGTWDQGSSSNIYNWNKVALFKYMDDSGSVAPYPYPISLNDIENIYVNNTINGYYLGGTGDQCLVDGATLNQKLSNYLTQSDFWSNFEMYIQGTYFCITESDIDNLIQTT